MLISDQIRWKWLRLKLDGNPVSFDADAANGVIEPFFAQPSGDPIIRDRANVIRGRDHR